ncbi:beta-1,4-mannooligosaccharide/beta-1,4-mannosyl-N-acetylglucosamine phosphorylase [Methylomarinovum tepidoasis]|uniref:Beta-1,4-mannooligosaccharide/beta-1,4-mannosyl-N-acetylglucosamine phosphorylase n=1 Tax=Methylomarinovum tepidoasis TaxID=2840183 RepID=A0AAU9CEM8_9GAMM|nr:glycoside hydrolase family 130 protein [Methylomarinovum sp. IN45]BCX87651.1 beta-1,4-mannooligosaccharide/beta-1,4-mannosyl-N-acetylglucosamine phosphorylase [Methylomarinovum sp. IN45]
MEKLHPFKRYEGNPILTRDDVPYWCNTVFNAAACKFGDQYLLLLRVEDLNGHSHLTLARSTDGYRFQVDERPWISPSADPRFEIYERYGIEDPRITYVREDRCWYITYTAYGPHGPRVGLGRTFDFETFERIALVTEVPNKDAVLFPEKIAGRYVMLDRPGGFAGGVGAVWVQYSQDLVYWGDAKALLGPQPGWGNSKLGTSTPPIATEVGWLVLYHGVRETPSGRIYRVGAMLLERGNPEKVIGYTPNFIFGPEELYERVGDVPNVVFPCGVIVEDGMLRMYYGAADTAIALAEARLDDIIELCRLAKSHEVKSR